MASRYHWVNGGLDVPFLNQTPAAINQTLALPAGSVLKKILVRGVFVAAVATGAGYDAVTPYLLSITITASSGANAGRQLYYGVFRVPVAITALYDVATTQRIVTAYHNLGDETAEVNQQCSLGQRTDPAWGVKIAMSLFGYVGGTLNTKSTGRFGFTSGLLYYL